MQKENKDIIKKAFTTKQSMNSLSKKSNSEASQNIEQTIGISKKSNIIQNTQSKKILSSSNLAEVLSLSKQKNENKDWKLNYQNLEQKHHNMIKELIYQLKQKDNEIVSLQTKLKQTQVLVPSNKMNHSSTVPDLINSKYLRQIEQLYLKIEELQIKKMHNQLKEEQWMSQHRSMTRKLSYYKAKENIKRDDQATSTQEQDSKVTNQNQNNSQTSMVLLKDKLLKILQANTRLTLKLRNDEIQNSHIKSNFGSPNKLYVKSGLSQILSKPFDYSKYSKNTGWSSAKTNFSPSNTFSSTFKSNSTTKSGWNLHSQSIDKTKWQKLKKNLEQIKGDNKVLRDFILKK